MTTAINKQFKPTMANAMLLFSNVTAAARAIPTKEKLAAKSATQSN